MKIPTRRQCLLIQSWFVWAVQPGASSFFRVCLLDGSGETPEVRLTTIRPRRPVLAASVSQSEFSYPMLVPTIMRYADDKRCGLRYLSDKWMMNGIILTIDSWIIFNEYTLFQDCSRHFLTTIWGTDGQPPPRSVLSTPCWWFAGAGDALLRSSSPTRVCILHVVWSASVLTPIFPSTVSVR